MIKFFLKKKKFYCNFKEYFICEYFIWYVFKFKKENENERGVIS